MQPTLNTRKQLINQYSEFFPSFCDKCGAKFDKQSAEIVSNDDAKTVCKLTCKSCANSFLMHLASPVPGIATSLRMPFKSAITTKELSKFTKSERIDSDEVIDLYDSLKNVNTIEDFNKLFRK